MLAAKEFSVHVDCELPTPVFVGGLADRGEDADGCDIGEDIESTHAGLDFSEDVDPLGFARYIQVKVFCLVTGSVDLVANSLSTFVVNIAHDDARALGRHHRSGCTADSTGTTRNHRNFSLEPVQ
jgi:hypothetical protein